MPQKACDRSRPCDRVSSPSSAATCDAVIALALGGGEVITEASAVCVGSDGADRTQHTRLQALASRGGGRASRAQGNELSGRQEAAWYRVATPVEALLGYRVAYVDVVCVHKYAHDCTRKVSSVQAAAVNGNAVAVSKQHESSASLLASPRRVLG